MSFIGAGGEEWIDLRVQDTGVGIPAQSLEQLFDAYAQVSSEHSRPLGGTGLGLTITRQFSEMLGGTITVQSELGQGSTFTVHLPRNMTADRPVQTPGIIRRSCSYDSSVESLENVHSS